MDITFDREMRKKVQDCVAMMLEVKEIARSLLLDFDLNESKRLDGIFVELAEAQGDIIVELYDHIGEEEE